MLPACFTIYFKILVWFPFPRPSRNCVCLNGSLCLPLISATPPFSLFPGSCKGNPPYWSRYLPFFFPDKGRSPCSAHSPFEFSRLAKTLPPPLFPPPQPTTTLSSGPVRLFSFFTPLPSISPGVAVSIVRFCLSFSPLCVPFPFVKCPGCRIAFPSFSLFRSQ